MYSAPSQPARPNQAPSPRQTRRTARTSQTERQTRPDRRKESPADSLRSPPATWSLRQSQPPGCRRRTQSCAGPFEAGLVTYLSRERSFHSLSSIDTLVHLLLPPGLWVLGGYDSRQPVAGADGESRLDGRLFPGATHLEPLVRVFTLCGPSSGSEEGLRFAKLARCVQREPGQLPIAAICLPVD